MVYATLFCILGVALVLGVLSAIFRYSTNLLNFALKILAPTSCLILALVSANLASSFGGYTLFISIGLAVAILIEAFKCVKTSELKPYETLFLGLSNTLSLICFAVAGIILVKFNVLALLGGLLLGLGAACIVLIFKKLKWQGWLSAVLNIALGGLMLEQSILLFISHANLIGTILYLISAVLLTFHLIFSMFVKENKVMVIISNISKMLGLLILALSIFFMI